MRSPFWPGYFPHMPNGSSKDSDTARSAAADAVSGTPGELARDLRAAREEIARLTEEHEDLRLLYEATIEHGEAVEDQLAENNILLKATRDRLEEELRDAARYVVSILPEKRVSDPKTDWLLVPSTELGGDSFGYHDIDDDHFAIYLLDVCGHGVGAALLSVTVINVLRAGALPNADFRDPSAVLGALNDAFPMEKQNNMFFTAWYGVYDRASRRLTYASGGHPPAIHHRAAPDGSVAQTLLVSKETLAIGAIAGAAYDCQVMSIEPGDRLLVLSDGTYEVSGETAGMLSFQDLLLVARRPGGDEPGAIFDWVRSVNGDGPLPDDFSLLRVSF